MGARRASPGRPLPRSLQSLGQANMGTSKAANWPQSAFPIGEGRRLSIPGRLLAVPGVRRAARQGPPNKPGPNNFPQPSASLSSSPIRRTLNPGQGLPNLFFLDPPGPRFFPIARPNYVRGLGVVRDLGLASFAIWEGEDVLCVAGQDR